MSTNAFPQYTVIASTDNGDFPLYTDDSDALADLVDEARRASRGGTIVVEENQVVVALGDDEVAEYLEQVAA